MHEVRERVMIVLHCIYPVGIISEWESVYKSDILLM
jgi:hypothetical protein